ncbi:MAG: hypothetical protein Q4F72_11640 [Desulfovibrionaceae bacterium]|nr:hypothetical protein [Desulfovibrionaceae bacterium]
MLFLELGVGLMTPMFIKEPFMDMVCQLPNAIYAPVNPRHAFVPDEIADRSIPVDEDIRFTFRTMLGQDTAHLAREASVFNPSRAY